MGSWSGRDVSKKRAIARSVTQCTDFAKAFFAYRMSCGFIGACVNLIFIYARWEKCGISCTDFHETDKCWTALCALFLYLISHKSDEKYGKYGYELIYARK
jgi:hypothetical protein